MTLPPQAPDRLQHLFQLQRELQERLGNSLAIEKDWNGSKARYISDMILCTTDELHEALREIPWKSWSKNPHLDLPAFRDELIDAWHFMINLTLASGMDVEQFYSRFTNKNKENHARQNEGY